MSITCWPACIWRRRRHDQFRSHHREPRPAARSEPNRLQPWPMPFGPAQQVVEAAGPQASHGLDARGQHRLRDRVPADLAVPAAGARRAVLHHPDRHRSRASEFGRMVERENLFKHIFSTAFIATVGFIIGSLLGAAMGYLLGMSVLIEKVLSPYLLGLQIAPKVAFAPLFIMWLGYNAWPKLLVTSPGGVLPDPGQRAAVDEDGRSRPDQSGARLQHEPAADLLEDRGAGVDAGADGGPAHRRDARGDRRHRRRTGRRQYRARLSHHVR